MPVKVSLRQAGVTLVTMTMAIALPAVDGGPASADVADLLPPSAPGRLAYSTGHVRDGGIGVDALGTIALDGSDRRVLTDPPGDGPAYGYDHSPQWSPDGNWLAYMQARSTDGGYDDNIAVLPRDGGEPQILDTDGHRPAWSPDGRHLAWVSYGEGGVDGTARTFIVADVVTTVSSITVTNRRILDIPVGAEFVGTPEFSPDGESLLFPAGRHATGNFTALYTMSMTDGRAHQVSNGRYLDSISHSASFSPDGSNILYRGIPEGQAAPEVVVVNVDGSGERVLPSDGYAGASTWTPDGDVAIAGGFRNGITLVGLDGKVVDRFAQRRFLSFDALVMAPDGSRIFSVAHPLSDLGAASGPADLYAIPLDGTAPQQLTFDHRVFPYTVQAIDPGAVIRRYGDGPAATAAAAVTSSVEKVDTLVVAPSDDYAASLAAAPLAAKLGAAELVTARTSLSVEVPTAARRLGATKVVTVGALAPAVVAQLRASGLEVRELARTRSPYSIAAKIASELNDRRAYLVPMRTGKPGQWKVPLATAGIATHQRRPLLFTKPKALSKSTKRVIRRLGITSVTVVGDKSSVGPDLLAQVKKLGVKVRRVKSSDPYQLSARFARQAAKSGARVERPVVATGLNWTSSTTAAALAALTGQVTVLVDGRSLERSKPTRKWLRSHRRITDTMTLVGGVRVVHPSVEAQLEGLT